ncbi:MAG: AcrR family transcriptional regulator [Oceanicoccus sp.]|jgi:AcrR family transcriptional regulator
MEKHELTYHHGDLKNALIVKATEIIEQQGLDGVSLRKVGAALGVSQAALYSHFKNKNSLLEAVATAAYQRLIDRQTEADQQSEGHMERVKSQGGAYVLFARQHPHLYRLMFGEMFAEGSNYPNLQSSRKRSFALLQDVLIEAFNTRDGELDPHVAAVGAHVLVHGLATLIIDGTLSPGKKTEQKQQDALVNQLLTFYCNSL